MKRVFTHEAINKETKEVERRFLSKRECAFYIANKPELVMKATGNKRDKKGFKDLYKQALNECGKCLI